MDFDPTAMRMYTSAELHAMNRHDVRPTRTVRKVMFSLWLWLPAGLRAHSQCITAQCTTAGPGSRNEVRPENLTIGCVNAQSVGNKSATLCHVIADDCLDVLVVTETWHENLESTSLKRTVPLGYRCIDAARLMPPDAAVESVFFQNHGGLAFIYRDCIKFQKKLLDFDILTFEYLFGLAKIRGRHVVMFGVYRPASQPLSSAFYDDLLAVFE